MSRRRPSQEAVVITPSGARCVETRQYAIGICEAGIAYVVDDRPRLTVRVISADYKDELWRSRGRVMSGVMRPRLNAKPSSSASPGRVRPPRPTISGDEQDFQDYKSAWRSRNGGLIVENS